MPSIAQRKLEHLRVFAQDHEIERQQSAWSRLKLRHRALPEIDLNAINPSCEFMGKSMSFPLLISSMTGGADQEIIQINQRLAQAAEHCGVALAVGSQRIMFSESQAKLSFALRAYAPTTLLFANLGAVQLNYGYQASHCQQAIDILQADALYLHLNPLQEAIQPEGNTNFSNLSQKIAEVNTAIHAPIILKEVGAGLSVADIALGAKAGIRYFDIAGAGGTSWARVEHHRRKEADDTLGLMFQDWGNESVLALKEAISHYPDYTFIASGGIRSGIDMAKAVSLGASLCGVAAPFVSAAQVSTEAVISVIERFRREYITCLFLLGAATHQAIFKQPHHLHQL